MTPAAVSRFIFTPHEQTARRPLDAWARDILALTLREDDHVIRLTFCANAGSLILVYAGHPERAEAICRAQLRWVGRMTDPRHGVNAGPPWLNLGRLADARGDRAAALAAFASLDPRRAAPVRFGELEVPESAWTAQDKDALRPRAFVMETMRLLLRHDPAAALAFAEERRAETRGEAREILDEGWLAAACLLGRAEEAASRATSLLADASGVAAAVLETRRCEAQLLLGRAPELPSSLDRASTNDLFAAFLLRRASELATLAGERERARPLTERALAMANALDDEILAIESLGWLAELAPHHRAVGDALAERRASSLYRRFRREPGTHASIDAMEASLLAALVLS